MNGERGFGLGQEPVRKEETVVGRRTGSNASLERIDEVRQEVVRRVQISARGEAALVAALTETTSSNAGCLAEAKG